jgi:hypothetical protein
MHLLPPHITTFSKVRFRIREKSLILAVADRIHNNDAEFSIYILVSYWNYIIIEKLSFIEFYLPYVSLLIVFGLVLLIVFG